MTERDPYEWLDPFEEIRRAEQVAVAAVQLYMLERGKRARPDAMRGLAVHHLDGDPHNNDLANLRLVKITDNARGQP